MFEINELPRNRIQCKKGNEIPQGNTHFLWMKSWHLKKYSFYMINELQRDFLLNYSSPQVTHKRIYF